MVAMWGRQDGPHGLVARLNTKPQNLSLGVISFKTSCILVIYTLISEINGIYPSELLFILGKLSMMCPIKWSSYNAIYLI